VRRNHHLAEERTVSLKTFLKLALVLALPLGSLAAAGPAAAASGGAVKAPAKPTAKARLALAAAAAKKWRADAALTYVTTNTANPDGTAASWMYIYDSPAGKEQRMVIVDEGGGVEVMPNSTAFRKPLGEFVDSDRAMAAAVAAGMKTNTWGMAMSLSVGERAEWFMSDPKFTYTIDAATGKLLAKEAD
jgi:hypothetical protein